MNNQLKNRIVIEILQLLRFILRIFCTLLVVDGLLSIIYMGINYDFIVDYERLFKHFYVMRYLFYLTGCIFYIPIIFLKNIGVSKINKILKTMIMLLCVCTMSDSISIARFTYEVANNSSYFYKWLVVNMVCVLLSFLSLLLIRRYEYRQIQQIETPSLGIAVMKKQQREE